MSCVKTETVNAPNLVPEVPPQSNPQRLRLHAPVSQVPYQNKAQIRREENISFVFL